MNMKCYLAMTASDLSAISQPPPHIAYMSCHFSGSNRGLSNLPARLPSGAMVIIDDLIPPQDHDPAMISGQVLRLINENNVTCILLDFQRPDYEKTREITFYLVNSLPCAVGVSSKYAVGLDCPVFLPPPPLHTTLKTHLQKWEGREIWLEIAEETAQVKITKDENTYSPMDYEPPWLFPFTEDALCCRYRIDLFEDHACFTLSRDQEMIEKLLQQAQEMDIAYTIGPYLQTN